MRHDHQSAGADLRSRDELLFRRREARLKTTDPLVKVAFNMLEKRWPQRVAFNELASMSRSIVHDRPIPIDHEFMTSETQRFAKTILDCFSSTLVDLHCDQSRCDAFPSEHPLANPLQMSQAREGSLVTTLLHTETSLDEFQRQVVLMSDGARSRSEIVDRIVERIQQGTLTIYGSQGTLWVDPDCLFHPDDVDRLRAWQLPVCTANEVDQLPATPSRSTDTAGKLESVNRVCPLLFHVRRQVFSDLQHRLALPVCNERFQHPVIPYFRPMHAETSAGPLYLNDLEAFSQRLLQAGHKIQSSPEILVSRH